MDISQREKKRGTKRKLRKISSAGGSRKRIEKARVTLTFVSAVVSDSGEMGKAVVVEGKWVKQSTRSCRHDLLSLSPLAPEGCGYTSSMLSARFSHDSVVYCDVMLIVGG